MLPNWLEWSGIAQHVWLEGLNSSALLLGFAQLDLRVSRIWGLGVWFFDASLLSQEVLEQGLGQRCVNTFPGCLHGHVKVKAGTLKMRHPRLFFPWGGGKTPQSSPFVPLQTLRRFLAGRGSYFVYVWTRILIDRISCNPILDYRFSSRLMQQIVSK